jgi:hypothetical protein
MEEKVAELKTLSRNRGNPELEVYFCENGLRSKYNFMKNTELTRAREVTT